MQQEPKLNIALLIYSDPFHFPPTINAANILAEKGHSVHLIGMENTDDWSQQLHKDVILINLKQSGSSYESFLLYLKSTFFIRRYLRKNKIDCLISYDAKSVLPSFIATISKKIKWIYHQHDFWEYPRGNWEKFLWYTERRLSRYADHVSFPQIQRAELFMKVASLKKFPIIAFNGPRKKWIDVNANENIIVKEFREKFDYILIYQGGWSKYFGLERLFDAIALCKTNTALILLGEEREKGLRNHYLQYLNKLGITDRVYMAKKYISYDELPAYTNYSDAAIGKLTGDSDEAPFNDRFLIGAANKITEYVACGLPVILQDSTSNREFFKKYPIGILADTTNKELFANTIDNLLSDQEKLKSIKHRNKKLFEDELNFDFQFQKIVDVIEPKTSVMLLIYSDPFHFPPTINAANILAEKGMDVHLIGLENTDNWSQHLSKDIKLVTIGYPKRGIEAFISYFKNIFFIRKYLRKNHISWLISYDAKSVLPSFLGTLLTKIKWIYHQHDFWETPLGAWEKFLWHSERKLSKFATFISFPQRQRAEFFKKLANLKKFPIIAYNGPRLLWLQNRSINAHPEIVRIKNKFNRVLIYQGGLSKNFCLENLILAIKYCTSNFALVFYGSELEQGFMDKLLQLAKENNIQDRVIFWKDYVEYDDLPSITLHCDVGIAKLTHDDMDAPVNDKYLAGASNKIAEYMAAGLPIIAADSEDNRRFYQPDNIGLLCDVKEPRQIAKTIDALLLNDELRISMGENNKKSFISKYNFDMQFQNVLDVINSSV